MSEVWDCSLGILREGVGRVPPGQSAEGCASLGGALRGPQGFGGFSQVEEAEGTGAATVITKATGTFERRVWGSQEGRNPSQRLWAVLVMFFIFYIL